MNTADSAALQPEMDLDVRIGANVHTLMWRAQEKQAALAVQWGMSQAALSLKLRGRRPWFAAEIDAAARHYKVTRDELFTKLPDLDSNQEPAGFMLAPEMQPIVDLSTRRKPRGSTSNQTTAVVSKFPLGA